MGRSSATRISPPYVELLWSGFKKPEKNLFKLLSVGLRCSYGQIQATYAVQITTKDKVLISVNQTFNAPTLKPLCNECFHLITQNHKITKARRYL